jgi:predicted polyphosphate/ATP-dependent NAD kinase
VRIGLIVNPVAGLGGRVGLKGSDGAGVQTLALALGAVPRASERAALALASLRSRLPDVAVLTAAGSMGEDAAVAAGFDPDVVYIPSSLTTPSDTRAATRELLRQGVSLLLFAGGDGTARDVLDGFGGSSGVLGVPTGVKMHSGVFGVNPRAAGEVAAAYLSDLSGAGRVGLREAEVMDLDEEAVRAGRVSARLYGYLPVPHVPLRVQQRKAGSTAATPEAIDGIAAEVAVRCRTGSASVPGDAAGFVVLGPGTTTRAVARALGFDVPVMGVNALSSSGVHADLSATELAGLGGRPWIVVTPIGGQGFLLGRGNQQISPEVLRAAGRDRLLVVATEAKLAGLAGRPLLVDTGDDELDRDLDGYVPVVTGLGRTTMYRITH